LGLGAGGPFMPLAIARPAPRPPSSVYPGVSPVAPTAPTR